VEQELPTLPEHLSSLPGFSGIRVTRSLVLCICFVDRGLSFCPFSSALLRVLNASNGVQCETQRAAQDILRWVADRTAVSIRVGVDLSSYIIESLTVN
jgi:hypothetical protein